MVTALALLHRTVAGIEPAQQAPVDFALGVLLLVMAAVTLGLRLGGRVDLLGWREPMQRALGHRAGDAAHFVLYTLSPAVLGVCFFVLWSVRRVM